MRRYKFYTRYGAATVPSIKKATGATQVLLPVKERTNVAGSSLVVIPAYEPWDGSADYLTSMEMWEYVWRQQPKSGLIVPLSLLDKAKQRAATYRVVLFPSHPMWIEARAQQVKVGWPFQDNTFLLAFD